MRSVGGIVVEPWGKRIRVVGTTVVVIVMIIHLNRRVRFFVMRGHREGSLIRVNVLVRPEVLVSGQALGLSVVSQRVHADCCRRNETETMNLRVRKRVAFRD